jgi:hypothetical protein
MCEPGQREQTHQEPHIGDEHAGEHLDVLGPLVVDRARAVAEEPAQPARQHREQGKEVRHQRVCIAMAGDLQIPGDVVPGPEPDERAE